MHVQFSILAWIPGPPELLVIGVVALIIFGRRLPEVARSMGKSVVEFKKGLKDVKDDVDSAAQQGDVQKALPSDKGSDEQGS